MAKTLKPNIKKQGNLWFAVLLNERSAFGYGKYPATAFENSELRRHGFERASEDDYLHAIQQDRYRNIIANRCRMVPRG